MRLLICLLYSTSISGIILLFTPLNATLCILLVAILCPSSVDLSLKCLRTTKIPNAVKQHAHTAVEWDFNYFYALIWIRFLQTKDPLSCIFCTARAYTVAMLIILCHIREVFLFYYIVAEIV